MLSLIACFCTYCVSVVSSEPSCNDTTHQHATVKEVTCSGFTKPEDFAKYFNRSEEFKDLWFVLEDSNLDYIPPGVLAGTGASILELKNVKVTSLEPLVPNANPFSGLEGTLRRISFTYGSSVPASWKLLKHLERLEELVFFEITRLNLTRDFNELPKSLKKVSIIRTTIDNVDQDWMASLENLENVRIQSSTLSNFSRSMLPRPAKKLRKLTIGDSSLTSLPKDFGEDFPAMTSVNVRQNLITTFEEESLSPFNNNKTIVVLTGNPVHCDCKVAFLLGYPDTWNYPQCETPEELVNSSVKDLTKEQLHCDNEGGLEIES